MLGFMRVSKHEEVVEKLNERIREAGNMEDSQAEVIGNLKASNSRLNTRIAELQTALANAKKPAARKASPVTKSAKAPVKGKVK